MCAIGRSFTTIKPSSVGQRLIFTSTILLTAMAPSSGHAATLLPNEPIANLGDAAAQTQVGGPEVDLLEPGQLPHRRLRIASSAGDETLLTMRMQLGVEVTIEGVSQASSNVVQESDIRLTVTDTAEDGTILTEQELTDVRVDAEPALKAEVQAKLAPLIGMPFGVSYDDRARIIETQLEMPEGLESSDVQLFEQLFQQVSSFSLPLPAEPVGIGAQWRTTSTVELNGIETVQTYTLELVELTDNGFVADVQLEQIPVAGSGPPEIEGVASRVVEGEIRGEGTLEFALDTLLPTRSSLETRGGFIFEISKGGRSFRIHQRVTGFTESFLASSVGTARHR